MQDTHTELREAAEEIRTRSGLRPRIGIVLGSWLGSLADEVTDATVVPFGDIPHFPVSTIPGRPGNLVLGRIAGESVAVMSTRVHAYEGCGPRRVVFPVQVMRKLGAEAVILTNAAGSVNPDLRPGTLMLLSDQINLTGLNPLIGPNDPRIGPRYPDMSEAYDGELRGLARRVAGRAGVPLAEGVYLGVLGPSFETPAEARMARLLGADAVGMSTVLEAIAARHCGLRTLGVSCITDVAGGPPPDEDALAAPLPAMREMAALVRGIVAGYGEAAAKVPLERVITRRK